MRRSLLGLLLLLLAGPTFGQALPVLPRTDQWVTDAAHLMSEQERLALAAKLRAYADSTSTQIVVVTLPSLQGADISQYATELGHQWRVGGEKLDNGIVVLVARDERQSFIATGRGAEGAVPDVLATRITRNVMGPRFREGQFYAGLNEAVDVLISALQGEFQGEAPATASEGGDTMGLICLVLVIVIFVVAMASSRNRKGGGGGTRRRRGWGGPIILPGGWGGGWSGGSGGGGGGGFDGGGFSGGGGDFGGGGGGSNW